MPASVHSSPFTHRCSYACDKATEHAERDPDAPVQLWEVLHGEIR